MDPPPTLCCLAASQSSTHLVFSHQTTPNAYKSTLDPLQLSSRFLVTESFPLFSLLQTIGQEQQKTRKRGETYVPSTTHVTYYSRVSALYRETLIQHLTHLETLQEQTPNSSDVDQQLFHASDVHSLITLAAVLYLPPDGLGDSVVGEEILEWINIRYPSPTQEESQALASLAQPYVSPSFWPYLYTCILRLLLPSASALLSTLSEHPIKAIRDTAQAFAELIVQMPRVRGFDGSWTEFTDATRSYRKRVSRTLQTAEFEFSTVSGYEEFYKRFEELADLLLGKESHILALASNWRDAVGASGALVRKGLRRDDLPELVKLVVEKKGGKLEGVAAIEVDLLKGDIVKALTKCGEYDLWLAAHLCDLLDKVGAVEDNPSYPHTLRDWFIFQYVSHILTDPGLWRIALDYLSTCTDPETKDRMKAIVLEALEEGGEVDRQKRIEEVLTACKDFEFEVEAKEICLRVTEELIKQKEYGKAVAYAYRADDAKRLARISDAILDEYVLHGEIEFAKCVDNIPTSLLLPTTDGDKDLSPKSQAVTAQPQFLARYRDFQAQYARGEKQEACDTLISLLIGRLAPKSFWAVMLVDALPLLEDTDPLVSTSQTYELILCLEELVSTFSQTGEDPDGYLMKLGRISGGGGAEMAYKRLEVVRFALARNLARGFASGF